MGISIQSNELSKEIAKRRWVRRLGLFSLPEKASMLIDGRSFFVNLRDWRGPSYHLLKWGMDTYEPECLQYLKNYLQEKQKPVFFDIGANVGIYSFYLTMNVPDLKTYAFEPEPISYSCLKLTQDENRFDQLQVFQTALSDTQGSFNFYLDSANHGGHSLNPHSIEDEGGHIEKSFSVQTLPLDDFCERNKIEKIDAIKMDVQRHEGSVLKGARESLEKFKPLIMMECYFEELLMKDSPLLTPLKKLGYHVADPKRPELPPVSLAEFKPMPLEGEKYRDFVFIP